MSQLASVHAIDGPTTLEHVRNEIAEHIESGLFLPGQVICIGTIAEQRRVRERGLRQLLPGLAERGLITIHQNRITVAPLQIDSIMAAIRLRRDLERFLITRSSESISPLELRRLAARLPDPRDASISRLDFSKELTEFELRLHRPGASDFEINLLHEIHLTARRYLTLAKHAPNNGLVREFGPPEVMRDRCIELSLATISEMQHGASAHLHEMRRDYQDDYEIFAQLAMEAVNGLEPEGMPWCSLGEASSESRE